MTDTSVHRMLPQIFSLSEFIGGSHAACGPDAELMALNELQTNGSIEDANHLVAIQNRDLVKGWFSNTGGEPLSSIYNDLNTFEHIHMIQYLPYSATPNVDGIHNSLRLFAGTYPIVLQVTNAQALTGNEQGVLSHFVMVNGIDSVSGYYILNGDDIQALPSSAGVVEYPGRWILWDSILNAKPAGIIVFGRNTTTIPANWKDDGTTLLAPNGIPVVRGFRNYILAHNPEWNTNVWPLRAEHVASDNSGSVQEFGVNLVWKSATNTFGESGGTVSHEDLSSEINQLEIIVNQLKAL